MQMLRPSIIVRMMAQFCCCVYQKAWPEWKKIYNKKTERNKTKQIFRKIIIITIIIIIIITAVIYIYEQHLRLNCNHVLAKKLVDTARMRPAM